MYQPKNPKDAALNQLCLFLAEEMRIHTISLGEAKGIARQVLTNGNLIDNEEHLLRLMIELSKDYPQLKKFEKKLTIYIERTSRNEAEKKVTEFVQQFMDKNQDLALSILDDAINSGNSLEALSQKYPEFAEFIKTT